MEAEQIDDLMVENIELQSRYIKRSVKIDIYQPSVTEHGESNLLLVNDGQDLLTMGFEKIIRTISRRIHLKPLVIVGIHCGADRKLEYGMSAGPDYKGWGSRAPSYEKFIIRELIPLLHSRFQNITFIHTAFAGFSLGGLSAIDIAWNHAEIFSMTAVFSGSLWWRSLDKNDRDYDPWQHRMMHKQVLESDRRPGMKFFFECGELDETEDRNKNGVIDSIDDTIDLMRLLIRKEYKEGKDIQYLQLPDGKHDVPSWAKAFPVFIEWAYQIS